MYLKGQCHEIDISVEGINILISKIFGKIFAALQYLCARINLSQAASGMILQIHRRLPVSIFSVKIAALGLLEGFLKLESNFKEAS